MSKESKVRKHRWSNQKSLIPVVIMTLIMMYVYFTVSQILLGVGIAFPIVLITYRDLLLDKVTDLATLFAVFGGFIALFFYYYWYKPEYKWKIHRSPFSWKITSPVLIYWFLFFGVAFTIAAGHFTCGIPALATALPMIAAGICEEVAFREVGISFMRRQLKGEKMIVPTLLITSAAFGVTHMMNFFMTGKFLDAAIQSALATMLGIFFGAVFIRTGDIWPCIAAHGMHDLLIVIFSVNIGAEKDHILITIVGVTCEALLMIWGLYLVRKEKHSEIEALWTEKWQIAESTDSVKQ